jgi:hypothetical protein
VDNSSEPETLEENEEEDEEEGDVTPPPHSPPREALFPRSVTSSAGKRGSQAASTGRSEPR